MNHCSPLSLLHMQLTCRYFYRTLEQNRHCWEVAFQRLHIPKCPDRWAPGMFANLLFGGGECGECHVSLWPLVKILDLSVVNSIVANGQQVCLRISFSVCAPVTLVNSLEVASPSSKPLTHRKPVFVEYTSMPLSPTRRYQTS